MKAALILIQVVIFSWLTFQWAHASDLIYVRAGEHGDFTRVVFEFQATIRSKEPIITGRGTFYVVFLDITTPLPRQAFHKITKGVHSVELIQEESRLTANITLSFPYFKLKTFSLSNPYRFIIDAYRISSPPKTSGLEESLQAELLNAEPDTEESLQTKPDTEEPLHSKPDKVVLTEPAETDQMIRTKKFSIDGNYNVQIYLLALLNVFTFIIIALLSFNLLKRRSMDDSEHLNEILESLKTTDESIATIEAMINRELKKIEHS